MMTNDKNIESISSLIRSYLPDARIILFGSRAKYEVKDRWSDYDLLIITEEKLSRDDLIHWTGFLNKKLVDTFEVPFDIIIKSEAEVERVKDSPGYLIRFAMEEGIAI